MISKGFTLYCVSGVTFSDAQRIYCYHIAFPCPPIQEPPMHLISRPRWTRQIVSRIAILWLLKAVGTMAFMAIFFWGYFGVLRNPLFPTMVMPLIGLDAWIPFT